jgi:hypothetical protein
VRVIFDRGLQVLHSDAGWFVPSSRSHDTLSSPEEFEERFAAHRITVYRDIAPFLYPRTVLDKTGGKLSTPRYLAGYVEDERRRVYKYQVEHFLFTAVTHLAYLAEAYAGLAVLKNHNEWQIGQDAVVTSSRHLYNSALLHSESIFAALASALHSSRHLVWRWKRRTPSSLSETLDISLRIGDERLAKLLGILDECQMVWGERLEAYRDCGAHYHSEETLGGRSGGELLVDDVWEILIDLPDNPEAHPDRFTFADDIDALDLGWDATTSVVRAIEASLPGVFQLADLFEPQARRWI